MRMSNVTKVREGLVNIKVLPRVFYNKNAKFNRSLSVIFLNAMATHLKRENFTIGDIMAATGVRGIRYKVESNVVDEIYFNDRSKNSYWNIMENTSLNNIKDSSNVTSLDVKSFLELFSHVKFDLIDIDPFGSPLPYMDSIFSQLRSRSGYLAFTATDLMTLCGVHLDALKRKYGVYVIKTDFCHEMAIRILLKEIFLAGNRYNYKITPILATFENQYIRIFIRYERQPSKINFDVLGYLLKSEDGGFKVISYSELDGYNIKNHKLIGPIWIGPYIDNVYVFTMLKILQEKEYLNIDKSTYYPVFKYVSRLSKDETTIPYIYRISKVCKELKVYTPPLSYIKEELEKNGFRMARSFLYQDGIRTDAPISLVKKIIKNYPLNKSPI